MVISDVAKFDQIANALGNRYLAVNLLSKMSRALGKRYSDSRISESKLLTWIITGECPYTDAQLEVRKIVSDSDGINDMLCWIQDDEVSAEVKSLYKQSIKQRHLTYCANNNLTTGQQDRVNILLRMIWYSYE